MPNGMNESSAVGLYIHFPFCRAKCPYCHFYSVPIDGSLLKLWEENLRREFALRAGGDFAVDTLYIGGGTPSLLGVDSLAEIVNELKSLFRLRLEEFTLEANPGRGAATHLRRWRDAGVNRLSIGVQSFDDRILKVLGREYTASDAAAFIEKARKAGFETIGVDLMIGVPTETRASLRKSVRRLMDLAPDHVSLYIMENVDGLPFDKFLKKHPVEDDAAADAYDFMKDELEAGGLIRYEISNFARPGKEGRHNLKYWLYEPFLGFGPSACSHLGEERWCNVPDLRAWTEALADGRDCREHVRRLRSRERLQEALVFGLRLSRGVSLSRLKSRFDLDPLRIYEKEIHELRAEGMLLLQADVLKIPDKYFLVSNSILSRFV